ncbi:hypothetical protein PspLS_03652 [Pyricularia sp. CBS 133598]|nr:hypothetical protein PspLS_03652 [Pyricularia sp. CBS 133598]
MMSPSSINSLLPHHVTAKNLVGRTCKVSEFLIIASLLSPQLVILRLVSFAFRGSISAMGPVLALPKLEPLSAMTSLRDTMQTVSLVDVVAWVKSLVPHLGFWEWILVTGIILLAIPTHIFIYNIWFHPLAAFPGPLMYRAFDSFKVYQQLTGNINHRLHEAHEKYGDVIRIAPWQLSYTTATAWTDITAGHKGQIPTNPAYGQAEKDLFGACGFLWVGNEEHARHRRVLSPAFSDKSLREQEPIVSKYLDLLVTRVKERSGDVVDFWLWMNFTTFDIIGDLTFGESFDCLKESRLHPWVDYLMSRLHMMMYGQIMTTMGKLGVLIEMMVPKRIMDEAKRHVSLAKDKVNRRIARTTDRPDFMTQILAHTTIDTEAAGESKHTNRLSLPELYADTQIMVIAGSETSAGLITAAAYFLLRNPKAMGRLVCEIRGAFAEESEVCNVAVSKLPYLNAVINESLRMRPPLPSGIDRKVGAGGAVVDGKFLAPGTSLQVTHWAAYHSARNFAEPWSFRPERWLSGREAEAEEEDVSVFAGDNKAVFQPFGVGSRGCLGRGLAYMETRLTLTRLVWNFDMELMPESEDWADQRVWMLYEKKPLNMRLVPRGMADSYELSAQTRDRLWHTAGESKAEVSA